MKVKISEIIIQKRARKKLGNLVELAGSIKKNGLLYPVLLEKETNILLDGERRLIACRDLLGWNEIEATYRENPEATDRKIVELEANFRRKNFTWQELCLLERELHLALVEKHGKAIVGKSGGWSLKKTAELIGKSEGGLVQDIHLAEAVLKFPELKEEETQYKAYRKWKVLEEAQIRSRYVKKAKEEMPEFSVDDYRKRLTLINGDCREELPKLKEGSVETIITDPPFGIELKGRPLIGGGGVFYDDKPAEILELIDSTCKELARVLNPDVGRGFMFFYITRYPKVLEVLSKHFKVIKIPFIWCKGRFMNPHPLPHTYETFFFFYHKKAHLENIRIKPTYTDVFSIRAPEPEGRIHPTEKPVALAEALVDCISHPGDTVLDPFAGSGLFPAIASKMGRIGIGIEKDPTYYNASYEKWFSEGEGGDKNDS